MMRLISGSDYAFAIQHWLGRMLMARFVSIGQTWWSNLKSPVGTNDFRTCSGVIGNPLSTHRDLGLVSS